MEAMRFAATQPRYSINNVMLILAQHPTATHVMGYRAWQKEGRQVRKGEKAIWILGGIHRNITVEDPRTGEERKQKVFTNRYKPVSVFAQDQTEGREIPKGRAQAARRRRHRARAVGEPAPVDRGAWLPVPRRASDPPRSQRRDRPKGPGRQGAARHAGQPAVQDGRPRACAHPGRSPGPTRLLRHAPRRCGGRGRSWRLHRLRASRAVVGPCTRCRTSPLGERGHRARSCRPIPITDS